MQIHCKNINTISEHKHTTMNKLQTNMYKLPHDVIQLIIGYSYNLQSKTLICDIQNYDTSKQQIIYIYDTFWTNYMREAEHEYKNWIVNDIISYMNDYQGTMYGYTPKFHTFINRVNLQQLNRVLDVNTFNTIIENKEIDTQINILWGLLLPQERNEIICRFEV